MIPATDAPRRPALRWYGGKWALAWWIIEHFPPHSNYVEPCCGASSVLLQKPRSPLETINDLDGAVCNFFRVLRDEPEELIRRIRLTPWAREEFEISHTETEEPIERARRFFVACWMSMYGQANTKESSTWRANHFSEGRYTLAVTEWAGLPDALPAIAGRLLGVQIENRDALEVIERYSGPETLIYFDPPYLATERGHSNTYTVETYDGFHVEAARLLRECPGYVVVSGYASDLYREKYEAHGWHRVDKEAQTNSGGKRIESLWLSPRTWAALDVPQQLRLLDAA